VIEALQGSVDLVEGEGAVLADDAGYGPLPGDEVAPTRRTAGDGNAGQAGARKLPYRGKRFGQKITVFSYRIVDIKEDIPNASCRGLIEFGDRDHIVTLLERNAALTKHGRRAIVAA
jgi:hypothetical protein